MFHFYSVFIFSTGCLGAGHVTASVGKAMHLFRDTILMDVMVCEACWNVPTGWDLSDGEPRNRKKSPSCLDLDGQCLFFRRITADMMIAEGILLMFKLLVQTRDQLHRAVP